MIDAHQTYAVETGEIKWWLHDKVAKDRGLGQLEAGYNSSMNYAVQLICTGE